MGHNMHTHFYKAGCVFALQQLKLGGERVAVTKHETYQHRPDPAFTTDTQAKGDAIGKTWDDHDRRYETAIRAPADITSSLTGWDG